MIWNSVTIMTVTDIAIIGTVGYALKFLFTSWRRTNDAALRTGFFAIIAGLGVIASFHAIDLIVRHLLPAVLESEAQLGADLLLATYWLITLTCVGSIVFGLTRLGRTIFTRFEELALSERRLSDYTAAGSDWLWEFDETYTFTYFSEPFTAFIGSSVWDAFDKDDSEIRESLAKRQPFKGLLSVHEQDGAPRWISSGAVPIFDSKGEFRGYRGVSTNITETKLAMAALKESELQFRHLVEGSLQGISISDGEKRLFVNQPFADMLGYDSPEEALAQLPYPQPFIGTDKEESRARVLDRIKNGGQGKPFEARMTRTDGTAIDVLIMDKAIEWRGKPAVLATLIDITERINAEQALRASEENFRRIVELSDQGFCIHDGIKPVFANSAAARIFGYESMEELLAIPNLASLIPDYELQHPNESNSERRSNERVPDTYELEGVKKDGTIFWIQFSAQKVAWEGQDLAGFTVTDISERKHREQALLESHKLLQSLIDGMPEFVALKNANDEYLFVNRVFEQWYDVPRSQVIGTTLRAVHSSHVAASFTALEKEAIEKRAPQSVERESTWPDGIVRRTIDTRFPVFDESGNIVARGTIARDVTELRRTESNLRQSQKMLAIGQLTGGIAHDFNNMLAVIRGNLELAAMTLDADHPATRYLEPAMTASDRGATLTQRLLSFARKQPLRVCTVDLRDLVVDLQDMLRRTLGETIDVEVLNPTELWFADIDPAQLEQALLNLALNARDAMPHGGKLTIQTANACVDEEYAQENSIAPGHYVVLTVSDTGCGLPPGTEEQIFEPFFTTKDVGQGTGLGLSMVWGFVKQSLGHVAVHSVPNQGTTFRLYLPRSPKTVEVEISQQPPPSARARTDEVILLVEDEDSLRDVIGSMVIENGYQLLCACDAESALATIDNASRVDLILTDVVLPRGLSGPDLAAKVVQNKPETKVLYMSGYTDRVLLPNGELDQSVELLQKPFAMDSLVARMRKVLDQVS